MNRPRPVMTNACANCAHLLITESSPTGLRCGVAYFKLPPILRAVKRLDHYPVTDPDLLCDKHQQKNQHISRLAL